MTIRERLVANSTADLARFRARARCAACEALGSDRADDVALVVSELVTNALEHGDGPPVDLEIVSDAIGELAICVDSRSTARPVSPPATTPAPQPRGRGLRIVATLADHVDVSGSDDRVRITARFRRR
jgi:anti-sigma regulatory factor (Ser/Thr protein kinase)